MRIPIAPLVGVGFVVALLAVNLSPLRDTIRSRHPASAPRAPVQPVVTQWPDGYRPPPTAPAPAAPVADRRIHPDSAFPDLVAELLQRPPLDTAAIGARAYHNDLEITVARPIMEIIDAASCEDQRQFAAGIQMAWASMGVGAGAGVTVRSSTGRELASAEQGVFGPRFHCE